MTLFKRSVQRYGATPEPVTPYQRAGQIWDDRLGDAAARAANWRMMAFGSLGLAALLGAGVVWQGAQSKIVPYVVEVDRFGEAQAVAPAAESYNPTDAQTAWYLGRFISNVRSLSIDPVVVRESWLEAYDFATDKAATYLNEHARAHDPFARIGDRSVAVQIVSVVRASDSTYQVKWREDSFEHGSLTSTENWTAMLTTVFRTPHTTDLLRKNPLGIYVNGLAWSQEVNAAKPRS